MAEANLNKTDNREFPAVDIYDEDGVISRQFLEAVENAVLENNAHFLDEIDENETLLSVLTIDDVVNVIQQEAEEDLMRLGGVGDEELSDSVLSTAKSRAQWLSFNLFTALASASIISIFDDTIEHMDTLVILMPIVASMGGNTATQTMTVTVTVRAIATKDIDIYNAMRVIRRELTIGLINGVLFALLIGTAAGFIVGKLDLGCIIASAMVINMLAAAFGRILIALLRNHFGADLAIASSVFVTMITDVVAFFSFHGSLRLRAHFDLIGSGLRSNPLFTMRFLSKNRFPLFEKTL